VPPPQFAWFLYDGQTDNLLAMAETKDTGAKDEVRTGMIYDPEYKGEFLGYDVADDHIASRVGRP
jgi:hypothetical protein